MNDINELKNIAAEIRKELFITVYNGGGGHIGGALSSVEIMTAIYFGGVLKYDAANPLAAERDRFILSKGHSSTLLYTVLAKAGFISKQTLSTYGKPGTMLGGHPKIGDIPGVEATTGALGHGLCFATGITLAGKLDNKSYKTFVLLGDGECQEGSVWEAALFAAQRNLGSLTAVIDYNKLQAMDKLSNIIGLESLTDKWRSFGWEVIEADGHNIEELLSAFNKKRSDNSPPLAVIAHTVKGRGISFMENQPLWHYRLPDKEELKIVKAELNISDGELG